MDMNQKQKALLRVGKEVVIPVRLKEFKCPVCGGVASVVCRDSVLRAECHACGIWVEERK